MTDLNEKALEAAAMTLKEKLKDGITAAFRQYASYEDARQAGIVDIAADACLSVLSALVQDEATVEAVALQMFKDSWQRNGNVPGPAREKAWAYSSGEWLSNARAALSVLAKGGAG